MVRIMPSRKDDEENGRAEMLEESGGSDAVREKDARVSAASHDYANIAYSSPA